MIALILNMDTAMTKKYAARLCQPEVHAQGALFWSQKVKFAFSKATPALLIHPLAPQVLGLNADLTDYKSDRAESLIAVLTRKETTWSAAMKMSVWESAPLANSQAKADALTLVLMEKLAMKENASINA